MAVQYNYNISCKRISDARWVTSMKAEHGEIPMSVVQPRTEVDAHFQPVETSGTLSTEPMVQEISDTGLVTAYLRGLNRRPGWELAWHNDAVIWNLSLRLGKMEIGQEVTVRVSYFSTKGIGSGIYEIKLSDVPPEDTPTKGSTHESTPSPQSAAIQPTSGGGNKTDNQPTSTSPSEDRKQEIASADSQLSALVGKLQDQLTMVQKTLHQALERIERLEATNRQRPEMPPRQDVIRQSPAQSTAETEAKQPATLSDDTELQAADAEGDTDEPNLFEVLAQTQKKSTTVKDVSTANDNVKNSQKKR